MPELGQEHNGLAAMHPILESVKTIAVLGVSANPDKPAHYVAQYMLESGYTILPVNASMVGESMFGQPIQATLGELNQAVDMVDMFRRAEFLESHLEDILSMNPRPRFVWLQLGIRNPDFTARLLEAGIDVVQDRCLMADHKNLRL